jgi:hypothetical protein
MTNPFNPLNWLKSAQDWFSKTERSSGFRPYLIYYIVLCGVSLSLLMLFRDVPPVRETALLMLRFGSGAFIVLFAAKAFLDPNFCRSESHVQKLFKLEVEAMGSEQEFLPAEVIEEIPPIEEPGVPPLPPGEGAEHQP